MTRRDQSGLLTREAALLRLREEYSLSQQRAAMLLILAETRRMVVWADLRIRMHVQGGVVLFSIERFE